MHRIWTHIFLAITFPSITLAGSTALAQSGSRTPAQAPSIQATAPRRQEPTGGGHPPASNAATLKTAPAPLTTLHAPYTGTLEGYVYWNTTAVQHNPATACTGLSVTVSVGTPPSGTTPTFEQFNAIGTYNTFTYLNNGSSFGACAYAVKVPVGQDLQVKVGVVPSSFSQAVAPVLPPTANDPNAPIKIISGKCNNLPPAVPSPSVLGSGWWTCGNYAYNVNFLLQGANRAIASSIGRGQLTQPSGTGSISSQHGMLASGAPQGILQQTPPATLLGNGGQPTNSVGGNAKADELNPQPYPPHGTNAAPPNEFSKNLQSAAHLSPTQADAALRPFFMQGVPKATPLVRNPQVPMGGIDPSVMALLHEQQQFPAISHLSSTSGGRGNQSNPSQPGITGPGSVPLDAVNQPVAGAPSPNMPATPMNTMAASGGPTSMGVPPVAVAVNTPSHQGSAGGGLSNIAAQARLDPCVLSSNPIIQAVNGQPSGVIFTPDSPPFSLPQVIVNSLGILFASVPPYPLVPNAHYTYVIHGCHFGLPGTVFLSQPGSNQSLIPLHHTAWTDTQIVVHLDPTVSGFLDQTVDLVVATSSIIKPHAVSHGHKFYGLRMVIPVTAMPKGTVTRQTSQPPGKYLLPPWTSSTFINSPTFMAIVGRFQPMGSVPNDYIFYVGKDTFSFVQGHGPPNGSNLNPAFSVYEWQMVPYVFPSMSCSPDHAQFDSQVQSIWGPPIKATGAYSSNVVVITVKTNYQTEDCSGNLGMAAYALNVRLIGPSGVNPWQ